MAYPDTTQGRMSAAAERLRVFVQQALDDKDASDDERHSIKGDLALVSNGAHLWARGRPE